MPTTTHPLFLKITTPVRVAGTPPATLTVEADPTRVGLQLAGTLSAGETKAELRPPPIPWTIVTAALLAVAAGATLAHLHNQATIKRAEAEAEEAASKLAEEEARRTFRARRSRRPRRLPR